MLAPLPPWQPSSLSHDLQPGNAPEGHPESSFLDRSKPHRDYTLIFVGDVMLARRVGATMQARHDWVYPFRKIAETLRAADIAYCNLECPISDRGRDRHHLYSFRADPQALEGLSAAGFDVVSQANNHSFDWGPEALSDSLQRLEKRGIRAVGAGGNDLAAHYPLLVNLGGLRVAFLAYVEVAPEQAAAGDNRPGVAWLEPERVLADIRFARPLADLVIVCPHWGVEYAVRPRRDQVELAHRMIDAGADLVVGSHPHVVQPLESYHGRWIAYSLGNFVFDQKPPATRRGLMLRVRVRGRQIAQVTPVSIRINSGFQAVLDASQTQKRITLLTHEGSLAQQAW